MMEINEPALDLEYVEDDFKEGEHEKLDEELHFYSSISQHFDVFSASLLANIVKQSEGRMLAKYLNVIECETLIKSEPRLRDVLLDGIKNGYKPVRLLSRTCLYPVISHLMPPL